MCDSKLEVAAALESSLSSQTGVRELFRMAHLGVNRQNSYQLSLFRMWHRQAIMDCLLILVYVNMLNERVAFG